MAYFRFRLHALMSLRQAERDQRRAALAAALAVEQQLRQRRDAVEASLAQHARQMRADAAAGAVDLKRLRAGGSYEAALRAQLTSFAESEQASRAESARCQDDLAAAQREVEVLEKLRERRNGEFQQAEVRSDARHTDEVASRAHRQQPAR
jgi:flagellar export protein FliJ